MYNKRKSKPNFKTKDPAPAPPTAKTAQKSGPATELRRREPRKGAWPKGITRKPVLPKGAVAGKDAPQREPLKTLERFISKAGLGSRTEARAWIAHGRVKVNGRHVRDADYWVDLEKDQILFDGKPVRVDDKKKIYIVLNKPRGYLTTYKDPEGRPTVYQLIGDIKDFLVPVGRLDLDTSGLLLMTNDTQFAEFVTNPKSKAPKTYLVKASTMLTDEQLDRLRAGPELDDGPTRQALVKRVRDSEKYTHFEIIITEGRNRQVRRMVEAVGSKVLKLVRVAIGSLEIGGLEIGKWRALTLEEMLQIKSRV